MALVSYLRICICPGILVHRVVRTALNCYKPVFPLERLYISIYRRSGNYLGFRLGLRSRLRSRRPGREQNACISV